MSRLLAPKAVVENNAIVAVCTVDEDLHYWFVVVL
jgi:hypothetical protein